MFKKLLRNLNRRSIPVPYDEARYLGRAPYPSHALELPQCYRSNVVMITGAGGSIGAELCHELMQSGLHKLILFEQNEFALYTIEFALSQIQTEMRSEGSEIACPEVVSILGSVTNAQLVADVLRQHQVDTIFHAAAYKHVPMVERNPVSGLSNNVMGTNTLALQARSAGVSRFVLISSDKAVSPINIMGASKKFGEMIVRDLASRPSRTVFSVVRFGNVLGSSGSVLPLFRDQIARGGPVTLTHLDTTRYFMSAKEAARLVLLAGSLAHGREIFVLDMGAPLSVHQLATQLIKDAGLQVCDPQNPNGDIAIEVSGLRNGEKLHEELCESHDRFPTSHDHIFRVDEACLSELEIADALRTLQSAIDRNDAPAARQAVARWITPTAEPAPVHAENREAPNAIILKF